MAFAFAARINTLTGVTETVNPANKNGFTKLADKINT